MAARFKESDDVDDFLEGEPDRAVDMMLYSYYMYLNPTQNPEP